jgi:hypothetical protein
VTILGGISKEELLRAIEEVDGDNGLLNGFLWVCSKRSKVLPEGGRLWEIVEVDEWRDVRPHSIAILACVSAGWSTMRKLQICGEGTRRRTVVCTRN